MSLGFWLRTFMSAAVNIYGYPWKERQTLVTLVFQTLIFRLVSWATLILRCLTWVVYWAQCALRHICQRNIYPWISFFCLQQPHLWHQSAVVPTAPQFGVLNILTKILNWGCCERKSRISLKTMISWLRLV